MSHPDELPDLLIDRSLGRIKVPALLRADGLRLVTLAEHYGIPADEEIADEDWLELCGQRGWLALMKDDRIRYLTVERRALVENRVRAAVITNANLSAEEMAARIIRAVPDLARVWASTGPVPVRRAGQPDRRDRSGPVAAKDRLVRRPNEAGSHPWRS